MVLGKQTVLYGNVGRINLMGRASQIFWFLNAGKMPSEEELTNYYTHLHVTDELKKLRAEHQRNLRKALIEKKEKIISEQERLF